eukprot:gene12851-3597_t
MLRLIGVSKVKGKVQGGFQTVRVIHASTYRGFESKGKGSRGFKQLSYHVDYRGSKVKGKVQGGFQTVRVIHASTYRGFESKGKVQGGFQTVRVIHASTYRGFESKGKGSRRIPNSSSYPCFDLSGFRNEYYKRSCLLMIVAFLAWYSGIMARNNPDKLSFSFFFLAMYGTQIIEYRESMKATNDGSLTARTEEDNISMMSSVNLSQSDFKSQASLRSGAGRRSKQSRPKTAESRDDTIEEEGSRRSSNSSSSSESDDSSSSSAEDDVDEQQSQRYSYGAYTESSRPVSATTKGSMEAGTEEGDEAAGESSHEEGAVEDENIDTNREKGHHSVMIEDENLQKSSYENGEEVDRILENQETGDDVESQENDRGELEGDEDAIVNDVDESNDEENAQEGAVNELDGEEGNQGFNANELDGEDQGNEANESIDEDGVKDNNKESLIEENEQGNDVNEPYGNEMQEDSSGNAEGIVEGQEIPNPASGDSADGSNDVDLGYNENGDESTA